ncbi:Os05g0144150 [Oryza sativa Japonica Group]|uniref:Os05g0144150 protein n=1 Tax=Oryza sativa subsp. japonica TaxID=39947 RepID=A0A0P0WHT2_ORYSJ|nr:hypothetical protein EE612_027051 [Oryza sativa]BAS92229.1 Os05g0144150 [Oryza sativa Japonica Group]
MCLFSFSSSSLAISFIISGRLSISFERFSIFFASASALNLSLRRALLFSSTLVTLFSNLTSEQPKHQQPGLHHLLQQLHLHHPHQEKISTYIFFSDCFTRNNKWHRFGP